MEGGITGKCTDWNSLTSVIYWCVWPRHNLQDPHFPKIFRKQTSHCGLYLEIMCSGTFLQFIRPMLCFLNSFLNVFFLLFPLLYCWCFEEQIVMTTNFTPKTFECLIIPSNTLLSTQIFQKSRQFLHCV